MSAWRLLGCIGILLFLSCSVTKKSSDNLDSDAVPIGIEGIIITEKQNEGCEVLIEYVDNGMKKFLIPIELPDGFKVGGTKVSFRYHLSRVKQSDCNIGQPAVIDAIKKM